MTLDIYNDDGELVLRRVFTRAEMECMTADTLDWSTDCEPLDNMLEALIHLAVDELTVYESMEHHKQVADLLKNP